MRFVVGVEVLDAEAVAAEARAACRRSRAGSRGRCCRPRARSRSAPGRRRRPSAPRARAARSAPGAFVCTITGAPVSTLAAATAARMRGTSPMIPCCSTAHLRNAALTPVSSMPSRISRTKSSAITSSRAVGEEARQLEERVDAGGDDDVEVDLGVDPLDARDVAAEARARSGRRSSWMPPSRSRRSFWIASATRTSSSQ